MEWEGRTLRGRYLLEQVLGEGADAVVYRARDLLLARSVAVKILRPERCFDAAIVERFVREARGTARLDHPAIVPVYDYGEVDGVPFLVMQHVAGGDLRGRLAADPPLPMDDALRLAAEVAEALGVAHAAGIVHRDIKPSNILLTPEGHARLADFGIAKVLQAPALSQTGAVIGTAYYLAPEQAGAGPVTPATDVYALGVVLFEMLTGRRPFEGESFVAVALQHLREPPPPLSALNPAIPSEIEAVVLRALAKAPAARFPDGAALAAALWPLVTGERPVERPRTPARTARLPAEPRVPMPLWAAASVQAARLTPPPPDAARALDPTRHLRLSPPASSAGRPPPRRQAPSPRPALRRAPAGPWPRPVRRGRVRLALWGASLAALGLLLTVGLRGLPSSQASTSRTPAGAAGEAPVAIASPTPFPPAAFATSPAASSVPTASPAAPAAEVEAPVPDPEVVNVPPTAPPAAPPSAVLIPPPWEPPGLLVRPATRGERYTEHNQDRQAERHERGPGRGRGRD